VEDILTHVLNKLDGSNELWLSGLWEFLLLHSPLSPRVLRTWSCISDATCLLQSTVYIHSPKTQISEVNPSGVSDLLTPVLSKSTALVLFGTSTLFNQDQVNGPLTSSSINDRDLLWDFGAFTHCFPLECSIPRVLDLVPCVHLQINSCRPLQDFGLQRFQIPVSPRSASQRVLSGVRNLMTCVLLQIDDSQLLRLFGVRTISNFTPSFSP
jgi:hypothetical protein